MSVVPDVQRIRSGAPMARFAVAGRVFTDSCNHRGTSRPFPARSGTGGIHSPSVPRLGLSARDGAGGYRRHGDVDGITRPSRIGQRAVVYVQSLQRDYDEPGKSTRR